MYAFLHETDRHTLMLIDRLSAFGGVASGPICNPAPGGDRSETALRGLHYAERVRTARQTQRGYTFPHIYLLERNIVALTKNSSMDVAAKDPKKIAILGRVRALNQANNDLGTLFSIVEGAKGCEETADEKVGCQRVELGAAARRF